MQFLRMSQVFSPADNIAPTAGLHIDARLLRAPKVLIAEDNDDIRIMMKMLLGMRGYDVVEARDGQETLEVAREQRPDIILMDLQLPRLNGFDVTRFLRQDEQLRNTPIVLVTGHDPAKHRSLALAAGCNAYIQKPIDFDSLGEMIIRLLPDA